jgi:hypothetical protein
MADASFAAAHGDRIVHVERKMRRQSHRSARFLARTSSLMNETVAHAARWLFLSVPVTLEGPAVENRYICAKCNVPLD